VLAKLTTYALVGIDALPVEVVDQTEFFVACALPYAGSAYKEELARTHFPAQKDYSFWRIAVLRGS
jgi:hypothetical protein